MSEIKASKAPGLGTFAGVFAPSVLTILGLILFLRVGFVIGNAGVFQTLAILGLATCVSLVTSSSLAAISTNIRVKKGGPYYIISRTLGPQLGGAIGLILFLAQAVSVAFYAAGFAEGLSAMLGWSDPLAVRAIAAATTLFLFGFAWLGADWASRLQMLVMVLLGVSITAFFAGALPSWSGERFSEALSAPGSGLGFWALFAIFFPAVTGFTQGVAMSGDLRDAGRSIPRGVFASIGVSTLVYVGVILAFSGALPLSELRSDPAAMRGLAPAGWLIDLGILSATLSSGMASILGAPRILQALAGDGVIRVLSPFAVGAGPTENPRRAALLTLAIAIAILSLGSIDVIAPIVSMFFLLSYGLLNYSTFYEARSQSPSFRPRFRHFSWQLSLVGALGCLLIMLAIDATSGLISMALLMLVFLYLRRSGPPGHWADSSRSYLLNQLRKSLGQIALAPEHPRDWRPHVLAFSDDRPRRERLLRFSAWLEGGSGMTTVVRMVFGSGPLVRRERAAVEQQLRAELAEGGFHAFSMAVAAPDMETGLGILLQSHGIGPVRANTILLNWLEEVPWYRHDEERERRYGATLRAALRLGKNVIVLEAEDHEWEAMNAVPSFERRIDIWWFDDASSRLLLLLAYLMTRTGEWANASLRTCVVTPGGVAEGYGAPLAEHVEQLLRDVRIDAQVVLVPDADVPTIQELSRGATLVLCPFRVRHEIPCDPFGGPLEELVSGLPVTALGIAGEDVQLSVDPDLSDAAQEALAIERANEAEAKAERAEREASAAAEQAELQIREAYASALADPGSAPAADEVQKLVARLREESERAVRRAAKARAKAELAKGEADLGEPGD